MKTSKGIHSETARARELATITCVLAEIQRQTEEREPY